MSLSGARGFSQEDGERSDDENRARSIAVDGAAEWLPAVVG